MKSKTPSDLNAQKHDAEFWNRSALDHLQKQIGALKRRWDEAEPFHFIVVDNFLPPSYAERILAEYPEPELEGWNSTTFVHQKKKFTKTLGFPPTIDAFFSLLSDERFKDQLTQITGIKDILGDPDLVGGGLHQILREGFLDVHVDFNYHPKMKIHRRMNLLLYMNKDWKREYDGYLELWDMEKNAQLADIAPLFNRAVVFETNEISYHGHPKPLKVPQEITRKSLAVYYYTETRESASVEHNTRYRQTTGLSGYLKTMRSAAESVIERGRTLGFKKLSKTLARKAWRIVRGLPPENN